MVTSYTPPSKYDQVHRATNHPGKETMLWHRENSRNAAFTDVDAAASRPVCQCCVEATLRQTATDHRRIHRPLPTIAGQQFCMDAFSHNHKSLHGYRYCDLVTDLASRQVYPVFTKDRSAEELCERISVLFRSHPEWKDTGSSPSPRFIRVDPERNYLSDDFRDCMYTFGYRIEKTAPRDKHAGGVAERTVGSVTAKANVALLAPTPPVPSRYWDTALAYACATQSFNLNKKIGTSPYTFITGQPVNMNYLHPFWSRCYVYIPVINRKSKLGSPRAYRAHFVGYSYSSLLTATYMVIEILDKGKYGQIRCSKDVIFDNSLNFSAEVAQDFPTDSDFAALHIDDTVPDLLEQEHALEPPVIDVDKFVPQPDPPAPYLPPYVPIPRHPYVAIHGQPQPAPLLDPVPDIPEEPDAVYWYSARSHEVPLVEAETCYQISMATKLSDPKVPRSFADAMLDKDWAAAIDKELAKFEINECFRIVENTGQHKVPMMWLFNIKTDGTLKARLVCRGDLMIPNVDFDPRAVFCTNVSSCSIKMCMAIAAKYCLVMRGGDLVGAYLVTLSNADYPWFIHTPPPYIIPSDKIIQAVGNIYGAPPAGQNFSKEFDKCMAESGYITTVYDQKFFYKWVGTQICLVIAHSDDFRWFGPEELLKEWDTLVAVFNAHKYEVTDCTDKEFVGIHIYHDEDFNYYMDQTRMVNQIIAEAGLTNSNVTRYHLPYPLDGENLSRKDNATEDQKAECSKYPYRKIIGQLMYGMVHTLVTIMYALNVLSRYSNNPGPRHIDFLKHLLRYVKYSKDDRLIFKSHKGPKDIKTMTDILQLRFQCDADLGGNLDNLHSQTSYLGYLGGSLICWCSTDQGSISTSTAESEIKAVNHTLKAEVIANRGILNAMGWKQEPTQIEEDNSACVAASNVTHMTRNLRHLDLTENWLKEKVADKTCILVKVESRLNNSDIGTKRVAHSLFNALTHDLVDRSKRANL
jgi:hypothetical protein